MNAQQPVITESMREQARQQPGGWVYCIDPFFEGQTAGVPPHGIVGAYRVGPRGEVTDEYQPNENYKPSPVARGMPEPRNELERAVQLWATEYGSVASVYEQFLIAELLLIVGDAEGEPAFIKVEGQEKEQVWVCTAEDAVPEFAEHTRPCVGYQLLPMLGERNVHIATAPDQHDMILVGQKAIAHSAPEITDELRAEAARAPGSTLMVPDPMFRGQPREELDDTAFIGGYQVDGSGELTGAYGPNPRYLPSPRTLGYPEPASELERVLQLHKTGHLPAGSLASALREDEALAECVGGKFVGTQLQKTEQRLVIASSSEKYVPAEVDETRAVPLRHLARVFAEASLLLDLGARHQLLIPCEYLLDLDETGSEPGQPQQAAPRAEPAPPREEPHRNQTTAPPPASPPDPHERFMGSMLAGAVGDALGFAIEFKQIGMIRRHHGEGGLTEPVLQDGVAQISDDTQMMLFTLEGLIRAHVARRLRPVDSDPVPEVQHAYQRWFHTQNQEWARAAGPYGQHLQRPDGWLITNPGLFAVRAPGNTCMSACGNFARTHRHATVDHRINDSKGCGGVMRAAPVAVWSNDPAEVFQAAVGTAALTHSHPSGYLSAGVLAVVVHQSIRSAPLLGSVRLARELLIRWPGHEEQLSILDAAVDLAGKGPVSPEELNGALGGGWVGEEALAIGLYAVLATDDVRDALLLSVNHSGDSDSTGIVCGNIAGAVHGLRAVPPEWLESLELHDVIQAIGRDALAEFSPSPPADASWTQRYPAW